MNGLPLCPESSLIPYLIVQAECFLMIRWLNHITFFFGAHPKNTKMISTIATFFCVFISFDFYNYSIFSSCRQITNHHHSICCKDFRSEK